jgi:hypothetical protein
MRAQDSLRSGLAGTELDPMPPRVAGGLDTAPGLPRKLCDWLTLAWALWWLWAYIQGALAERFPHALGWTRNLW